MSDGQMSKSMLEKRVRRASLADPDGETDTKTSLHIKSVCFDAGGEWMCGTAAARL